MKMSFCLKASSLHESDLAAITDSIEHYQRAGMDEVQAETAAVADLLKAVHAERTEMVGHLREQHPDLFSSDRQPVKPSKPATARADLFDNLTDKDMADSGYAAAAPEVKALAEHLMADAEARGLHEGTADETAAHLQTLLDDARTAERPEGDITHAAEGSGERGREAVGGQEQGAGPATGNAGRTEPGSVTLEPEAKAPSTTKVEDFGQKLEGARKDQAPSLREELSDDAIESQPFSKIWPASEVDGIEDTFAAAVATAARAEVPAKPRVQYKLDRWVEKVKTVRDLAQMIVSGKVTREALLEGLAQRYALKDLGAKIRLLEGIERDQWGRIGAVSEAPEAYGYEDGKKVLTPMVRVEVDGKSHWLRGGGDVADHVDPVRMLLGMPQAEKKMAFEIRGRTGAWSINKKGDKEYRKLKTFQTPEEARKYINESHAELVAAWEGVKATDNVKETDVRGAENRPRTAEDYRKGKDTTPELFAETFGFRGVQFGNWVAQGDDKKARQGMLNQAFDGLMDLATIVGVTPRALSLNGTLGLSFGARGHGWASAHFEPSNLVINLTKTRGAGTLAHEWFHALDNYFARSRGGEVPFSGNQQDYRKNNYVTYKPERVLVRKDGRGVPASVARLKQLQQMQPTASAYAAENWMPDPKHPNGVRPEVEARFAELVKALNDSPMSARAALIDKGKSDGYWSQIIERAARSFENYTISKMMQKGYHNDYLANVTAVEDFARDKARYPYLLPDEIAPVAKAFDDLFSTIETKQDEAGNTAMFSLNHQDFQDTELLPRPEVHEGAPAPQDVAAVAKLEAAFRGKVDAFKGLQLTALPRMDKPGPNASAKEKERYAAVDLAEKAYGKRVVFFSSNIQFANGMQADYLPGMVFVNENTTRPIMAVLGHELLHSMRQDHPALYARLGDRLRAVLEEPGKYGEQLNARRATKGMEPLSFDKLREELVADIVGDNFTDPVFWRKMAQGQPTLFARVLRLVKDFFDNLLSKLKNERPYGTDKYLNDVQAARDAVVEAMSQFVASPKTAAAAVTTAAQAEVNQTDTNEPFYSELGRQVERARMASAPAQGWKDWLKGLVNKGTIKADEVAWTGLEDYLNLQQGKVSREQVMEFLNGNGVKVTETTLGGAGAMSPEMRTALNDLRPNGAHEAQTASDWLGYADRFEAIAKQWQANGDKKHSKRFFQLAEEANEMAERLETDSGIGAGATKYSQYTLPGGSNYREVLLTLPADKSKGARVRRFTEIQQEMDDATPERYAELHAERARLADEAEADTNKAYQSGHWDQPNVLAHIRLNDRTDADGKRVLFVEEIQSDWGQAGKKGGFKPADAQAEIARLQAEDDAMYGGAKTDAEISAAISKLTPEQRARTQEIQRRITELNTARVPEAPFVQKTDAWVSLAIKRVIKMAVDEGYDRVAFVNGEQSAERYDLSKQISRVVYQDASSGGVGLPDLKAPEGKGNLSAFDMSGKRVIDVYVSADKVEDYIGKEAARKLFEAEATSTRAAGVGHRQRQLEGIDLKVGGEGMKAFYDKIVPTIAKDVMKKLGGSLGRVAIDAPNDSAQNRLRYVGPIPTAQEWASLDKMARGYGNEMVSPFTGKTLAYSINRVAVANETTRIGRAMKSGQSFNDAMVEHGGNFLAEVIGGKIEPVPLAEQARLTLPQFGFDITDSMREKAAGGLPMFSLQYTPEEQEALRKAGINTQTRLQRAGDRIHLYYANAMRAWSSNWAKQFQQGTLDQFTGIRNAVTREIGALPTDQDPYVAARLANGGTSSVMRGLMLHGQAKWAANGQHLEKIPGSQGLLDILKPLGTNLNSFFGWMIGNRAARLMAEGRENNFTPEQIKLLQALNRGHEAEFRTAALAYAQFKRSVLDVAEQAGLLDPESRKVWDNADYIPFYREIDDKAVFGATGKKGLSGQSSGIRTLKGGDAVLNDPMENILMNFSRLIDASLKNSALAKTMSVLTAANSDIATKVGYDMNRQLVPADQVKKQLLAAGTPQQIIDIIPSDAFEGMAKMWAIQAPTDPDVVRIMVGGKPQFYKVHDPLLLKSLTSFVPFDFPGLGVARAFKRVLTGMVTATPEFMARNWIRDTGATAIITRDGFNPIKSLTGVIKSYREAGAFEELLFAGASFQSGHINASDPTEVGKAMRRALRERGFDASSASAFMASIVDTPVKWWEHYRHFGEAIENGNREAVYEAAVKANKGLTAAAYESKDLMDFTLRGSSPMYQLLADVLPFFNARVQGLYRVGRADPKRLAVYGSLMMLATLALAYANSGNDDYDSLPDWDKESYWHFWIHGQHLRVPKPFELGAVFASIPERIMRYAMGQDTGKKALSRIWAIARDQLAFDPVPQVIRPALNAWANKDTFRDRPLENQGDEGKLPSQRYSKITSPTAVAVTKAIAPVADEIGLSPKKLEYLVGGYLGTAGLYALGLSDMAVRKMSNEPVQPATRLDQIPLIGSFYRQEPAFSTVYETDLYKMRTEVEQIFKSVKALRKDDHEAEADALEAKDEKLLDARKELERAGKRLTKLNKERDAIYADREMTAQQKRVAIDELLRERAQVSKEAMKSEEVVNAQ